MVIYILYGKGGKIVTTVAGIVHVVPGESDKLVATVLSNTVIASSKDKGVAMSKVMAFCSDGASDMTGCKTGVGVKLQSQNQFRRCIHCVAIVWLCVAQTQLLTWTTQNLLRLSLIASVPSSTDPVMLYSVVLAILK